ncbi:MAG: SufE family protein [Myxococcota bacterium]
MTTIAQRQAALVERFGKISDWEERYGEIIRLGRLLPEFPEDKRTELNKVKGCQSQVWMHASLQDGNVVFVADSDAAIVRGLIAILLELYSGQPPRAILEAPPSFIDELGLGSHLSQNRANGLSAMLKQMKLYATAFQALAQRSV